jgi:hypothetical protein
LWQLDGEPLCTDDHVRKIISVLAMQLLAQEATWAGGLADAVQKLRALREVSQRSGLSDLSEVLGRAIASLRASATGLPQSDIRAVVDQLGAWATLPVAPFAA